MINDMYVYGLLKNRSIRIWFLNTYINRFDLSIDPHIIFLKPRVYLFQACKQVNKPNGSPRLVSHC